MDASMATWGVRKALPWVIKTLFGAAAGGVASTAGQVVGSFVTAFAITTAAIKYLDNLGTIEHDSQDLIGRLTYLAGKDDNEFKKLMDQVIVKIAGSAYEMHKMADEAKTAIKPDPKNPMSEESITAMVTLQNYLNSFLKNYNDLMEGLDILKKKETRDLYIKYSENILGTIGRGLDWSVSKARSFGFLSEDKAGENITGWGINYFDDTMSKVQNIEAKVNKLMMEMSPIKDMIEHYNKQIQDIQKDVNLVSQASKDEPELWEDIKKEISKMPTEEDKATSDEVKKITMLSFNNFMKAAELMLK